MIDEQVKLHDKLSAEIKVSFGARKKVKVNDFTFNIWMFIPNSLDINRHNYSKADFYRDLKSNIRLTTPVFILRDIIDSESSPFVHLRKSFKNLTSQPTRTNSEEYEYQIKMFLSILKSSLREEVNHILSSSKDDVEYLINNYTINIKKVFNLYRELYLIINVPTVEKRYMEFYRYGDEFMINIIEKHCFMLLKGIKKFNESSVPGNKEKVLLLINELISYKKSKGYLMADEDSADKNGAFIHRMGMLKKYAESDLFLDIKKRRDGVWLEQILFSLAAGISMIFATVIAFSVQQKFGNYTMPLFVALVVSYMLKDRIKELTRYYFAHRIGDKYFDHKIMMNMNNTGIGWAKESVDFIPERNVPQEIIKRRDRPEILEATYKGAAEKVILYKMHMHINREKLNTISPYFFSGVNSIIRFNVTHLLRNMDNPEFNLFTSDNNEGFKVIKGKKYYYLSLIIQKQNENQNELIHYRLILNRDGIQSIQTIS